MAELTWKEEYRINHFQTDEEHKKLIVLANKVIAFSDSGEDPEKVKSALKALKDYTKIHFRNEEAYMERIGFKELEYHKQCHSDLIDRMNSVLTQNKTLDGQVHQLKRLMVVWVIEHIINEDKKIALAVS